MSSLGVPKNHKLRFYSSFFSEKKMSPKDFGPLFCKSVELFVYASSLEPAIATKLSFTGTS